MANFPPILQSLEESTQNPCRRDKAPEILIPDINDVAALLAVNAFGIVAQSGPANQPSGGPVQRAQPGPANQASGGPVQRP